jgi:hypothetical protein
MHALKFEGSTHLSGAGRLGARGAARGGADPSPGWPAGKDDQYTHSLQKFTDNAIPENEI